MNMLQKILKDFDLNWERGRKKGTDKGTRHSYVDFYQGLFWWLFDQEVKLLEVGVKTGGSAKMWVEAFPNGKFCFVDVDIEQCMEDLPDGTLMKADGYTLDTAQRVSALFPEGLDIAIDDGDHTTEHQTLFVELYGPLVKPGGFLVVEDPRTVRRLLALENRYKKWVGWTVHGMNFRTQKYRHDNLLLVMRRDPLPKR